MLEIINNLRFFFEDCYRRISVREYSKLAGLSPPTASKILSNFNEEGLLSREKYRNYIFYYADKNDKIFVELSRIYWKIKLKKLTDFLNKNLTVSAVILFGSLSKAEAKEDSDIDFCIIGEKKELSLANFEKTLKRKIQLFFFNSVKEVKNEELLNNIINGYLLEGRLRL